MFLRVKGIEEDIGTIERGGEGGSDCISSVVCG